MRFLTVLTLALLAACSPGPEPAEAPAPLVPLKHPHFTVRGRLEAPSIRYAIDGANAAVPEGRLAAACSDAAATWNRTGVAEFLPAEGSRADLTISFQRDVHGPCTPFGRSPILAHTGPCGPGNYIHLDAERDWVTDEGILTRILAHEFGHALGLGHSLDPAALMNPEDDPRRTEPLASDLAGLHSLYGGGTVAEGDLAIFEGDCGSRPEPLAVLRGVAPESQTQVAAFDTQGDGVCEVLVWRTDKEGHGDLCIFSLDRSLRLTKTLGPLHGICPPGTKIHLGVTTENERLLLRVEDSGRVHALRFAAGGELHPRDHATFTMPSYADADGDGQLDDVPPVSGELAAQSNCLFTIDLNSDGQLESVTRLVPPGGLDEQ